MPHHMTHKLQPPPKNLNFPPISNFEFPPQPKKLNSLPAPINKTKIDLSLSLNLSLFLVQIRAPPLAVHCLVAARKYCYVYCLMYHVLFNVYTIDIVFVQEFRSMIIKFSHISVYVSMYLSYNQKLAIIHFFTLFFHE